MLNFVIRGLKVLAVLCTVMLIYLVYASIAGRRDSWTGASDPAPSSG